MTSASPGIQIVPLVPNVELPRRASPRTRTSIPSGYGVQEQCLPFTAASGLGILIPSPIRFGHCPLGEVPQACRAFRSPVPVKGPQADWVFYVADNPACRFSGNAYHFQDLPGESTVLEPGISFFDREDQQALFKLHLPYIWRTPPEIDLLFLPLVNREATQDLAVQSGLVETDWYSSPVNLILRKPASAAHIKEGQEIAQAILISRLLRNPAVNTADERSPLIQDTRKALVEWYRQHNQDRGAYKGLARSRQGRIES